MDPVMLGGIVLIFVVMYMLMIRPQRKKEKAITAMRNALKVGDKIVTIGGIKGKIVSVKDESLMVAVGSDKVKIEFMRWAISRLDEEAPATKGSTAAKEEAKEEEKPAAKKPRKLSASAAKVDDEPETEDIEEEVQEEPEPAAETVRKPRSLKTAKAEAEVEEENYEEWLNKE